MLKITKLLILSLPILALGGFLANGASLLVQVIILGICTAVIGLLTLYNLFPRVMLNVLNAITAKQAGVSDKTIMLGQYEMPYYEGGEGETLILIHGLGVDKTNFHPMLKLVTAHYHVLLPEVPGFGQTERQSERDHSIRSQVEMIHQFVLAKKLTKFYLGGNSMGGHISAAYTLAHPEYVKKLIILNSPGMLEEDEETPYVSVEHPLRSYEEFDTEMAKVFANTPFIPKPVKDMFMADSIKYFDWNNQIVRQIREGEDHVLTGRVQQIQQPTLVIWGKQDQIVDLSIGEAYHKEIPNSELRVFDPAGHAPQYEVPEKTADAIIEFLKA